MRALYQGERAPDLQTTKSEKLLGRLLRFGDPGTDEIDIGPSPSARPRLMTYYCTHSLSQRGWFGSNEYIVPHLTFISERMYYQNIIFYAYFVSNPKVFINTWKH